MIFDARIENQTTELSTLELRRTPAAVYLPPSLESGRCRGEGLLRLPKVMLLVDGDSMADLGWSSYPMPVRRRSLVDNVASLCAEFGASAQIVFDSSISPRCPHSQREQSVEVRLSSEVTSPSAAIVELVERHSTNRPLVVVSLDPELRVRDGHRAEPLAPTQLLDLFLRSQ